MHGLLDFDQEDFKETFLVCRMRARPMERLYERPDPFLHIPSQQELRGWKLQASQAESLLVLATEDDKAAF